MSALIPGGIALLCKQACGTLDALSDLHVCRAQAALIRERLAGKDAEVPLARRIGSVVATLRGASEMARELGYGSIAATIDTALEDLGKAWDLALRAERRAA